MHNLKSSHFIPNSFRIPFLSVRSQIWTPIQRLSFERYEFNNTSRIIPNNRGVCHFSLYIFFNGVFHRFICPRRRSFIRNTSNCLVEICENLQKVDTEENISN